MPGRQMRSPSTEVPLPVPVGDGRSPALACPSCLSPSLPMPAPAITPFTQSRAADLFKARVPDSTLLDRRIGMQGGVTDGGTYQDQDGASWYVKQHRNPEHAFSEHLANVIYRKTGHNAPHTMLRHNPTTGTTTYLSKYMPEFTTQGTHLKSKGQTDLYRDMWNHTDANAPTQYLKGTAVDAFVHAQDMHYENVGHFTGKDGKTHAARIDNGGALLHNAFGTRKDGYVLGSLRDYRPVHQQATHDALTALGHQDVDPMQSHAILAPGLKAIDALHAEHDHNWQSFVDRHIPMASSSFRKDMATLLDGRHRALQAHVASLKTGATPMATPSSAPTRPASTRPSPALPSPAPSGGDRLNALKQRLAGRASMEAR